jgi:hypothetical protein
MDVPRGEATTWPLLCLGRSSYTYQFNSIHISAWQWHMHDHGRPVVNQPLSNPNIPNDLASSHAVSPVSLLMHSPVGPFDPLASAEVRKSPAPDQYLTSRFTVCCWYLPYPKIIGLDSIWTCPFWDLFQP